MEGFIFAQQVQEPFLGKKNRWSLPAKLRKNQSNTRKLPQIQKSRFSGVSEYIRILHLLCVHPQDFHRMVMNVEKKQKTEKES